MKKNLLISILFTLVTTVLFGIGYPLLVTGLAQVIFPRQANGELIQRGGKLVGSHLIGQPFTAPGYFNSRPSAAGAAGYNARKSAGFQSWAAEQGSFGSRLRECETTAADKS